MASTTFDMYVTNVDLEKTCLKIYGQTDKNTPLYIEKLLQQAAPQFDMGHGIPAPNHLQIGGLYIAKYKDDCYYRAKVTGLQPMALGKFEVRFIDYGNTEYISGSNLRIIDNYLNALLSLPPQAVEFFLAQISCNNENTVNLLRREICYTEVQCCNVAVMGANRIIRIFVNNVDLSQNLVNRNLATLISPQDQDAKLNAPLACAPQPQSPSLLPASSNAIPFQYKCDKLEVGTQHLVYVSYVSDGPCLFSIQQKKMEEPLSKLMIDITHHPLTPFVDTPMEGSVCMACSKEMPEMCRAVITNIVDGQFKLFFVDFGNTEVLPLSKIYQIPLKFVIPKVMSLRFILAGIEGIGLTHEMKVQFKSYVQDKLLRMEVVPTTGNIPIQRCNLYDGDVNLLSILQQAALLAYQPALAPARGLQNVRVSFIMSCNKFFVQLLNKADSLNDLMNKLSEYCPNALPMTNIRSGLPCCALYSGDEQWYRAQIITKTAEGVVVNFIDYGNEETVQPQSLRAISPNLVTTLRAQALECCLVGYQNMPKNEKLDELFETLALEQDFMMKVVESRPNGVLLVDLVDPSGNQVVAMLIEKLAASGIKDSTKSFSPQPHESSAKQRDSPRTKKDFPKYPSENRESKTSPVKENWRDLRISPPKSDERQNNAHNFYQRKESQKAKEHNSPPRSGFSSDRRSSREREFKRKPRNDSFESTGRPFDDNMENSRHKGKGDPSFNNKVERQSKAGAAAQSKGGREFKGNRTEEQNGYGENFGKARTGFSSSGQKKSGRDQQKSFSSSGEEYEGNKTASSKSKQPPPDYAAFTESYIQQQVTGNNEKINISWFYDPANWFCQLERSSAEFRKLMYDIQAAYASRSPENSALPIGASVIAKFNEDNALYRATVLEKNGHQYKVIFVDFGNVSTTNKLWKIEKRFMTFPSQAINCAINGILPQGGASWPPSSAFDAIFNKDSFECYFENVDIDGKYSVILKHGSENISETLIQSNLATSSTACVPPETEVPEVEEPVCLYLLYGQTVSARLSHVESFDKFYVQMEPWKIDNMSGITESLYNNGKLTRLQNPQPEDVCVTKYSSFWSRGIVKEINGSELNIVFPDWGSRETVVSENVYNLPATLNDWYQSYECSIHTADYSVTEKQNSVLETLKQYLNKTVILHVNEVIETRLDVTIYDNIKLTPLLAVGSISKVTQPVCAFPVLREHTKVWVSYVSDSHFKNYPSVFVQSSYLTLALDSLLENLANFYTENANLPEFSVEVNKICAALSTDGNWYRAEIIGVEDTGVKVQFIDYGNTELIESGHLRTLDSGFYEPHRLALELRLNYMPTEKLGDELSEALTDKEFNAEIFDVNENWYVELTADVENPLKVLLEEGLLLPIPEEEVITGNTINKNTVPVIVSHVDSPGQFYVQLSESLKALEKLQADLQVQVLELPVMESPGDGVICAAPYSVDQLWYRAQVLDADNDITTVRFIDYGNTDVINNTTTQVKTLMNTELLTVEPYSRRCSLELKPIDEEWSSSACERFEMLIDVEEITAQFVQQSERTAYINLLVDGKDISEILIKEGLAIKDTPTKRENITGYVSHINSASEFWVQLESAVEDLEHISYQLANATGFPEVGDVSPGSLCCALFPDDESWYRVRILSNTVAGIEVLFIDYGNSCTCNQLRALPEDLVHLPVLAHKCSLKKPENVQSWSARANEKFREVANDGATIFTVSNLTAGETSTVELLLDGKNISMELLNESASPEIPVEAAYVETSNATVLDDSDESPNSRIPISVSYFESAAKFWIVKQSDSHKLAALSEALKMAPCWGALFDLCPEGLIAAMCIHENRWYRAKILSKKGPSYKIHYVDYGAQDETWQVRLLRDNLDEAPAYATCCTLEGEWSSNASENLAALIGKPNPDALQVEILDDKVPCTVRLYLNGTDVCDLVQKDEPEEKYVEIKVGGLGVKPPSEVEETQVSEATRELKAESLEVKPPSEVDSQLKETKALEAGAELIQESLKVKPLPGIESEPKEAQVLEAKPELKVENLEVQPLSEVESELKETKVLEPESELIQESLKVKPLSEVECESKGAKVLIEELELKSESSEVKPLPEIENEPKETEILEAKPELRVENLEVKPPSEVESELKETKVSEAESELIQESLKVKPLSEVECEPKEAKALVIELELKAESSEVKPPPENESVPKETEVLVAKPELRVENLEVQPPSEVENQAVILSELKPEQSLATEILIAEEAEQSNLETTEYKLKPSNDTMEKRAPPENININLQGGKSAANLQEEKTQLTLEMEGIVSEMEKQVLKHAKEANVPPILETTVETKPMQLIEREIEEKRMPSSEIDSESKTEQDQRFNDNQQESNESNAANTVDFVADTQEAKLDSGIGSSITDNNDERISLESKSQPMCDNSNNVSVGSVPEIADELESSHQESMISGSEEMKTDNNLEETKDTESIKSDDKPLDLSYKSTNSTEGRKDEDPNETEDKNEK